MQFIVAFSRWNIPTITSCIVIVSRECEPDRTTSRAPFDISNDAIFHVNMKNIRELRSPSELKMMGQRKTRIRKNVLMREFLSF